ncbi:MAG TPA: Gfo/Idh/MocA family oxidoreductase [Candidatus Aquilonibacter sp.]|nr:Gfo/Idh/MocA family oxidoreductase [Candidatus Aquilonibacter sp.]
MKKLRIGFVSTANIGRKNWKAISASGNCVVSAVASRDLVRSRKFIRECQAETPFAAESEALGSYDELLASENVDAVYLPLPTALRKDLAIRAAENGKHVLCEKPCAASVAEVEQMIAACKKNRVQFMDGVMFMHNRRLEKIRATLDDKNSVGQIKRITSQFSFFGSEDFLGSNIRVNPALEPHGCLGDLGWYCIRFTLWTMNWQMPRRVEGKMISAAPGNSRSPVEFSAELFFDGGVSAGFYCSFLTCFRQWVEVGGANGHLRVPDFVLPFPASGMAFEVNDRIVKTGKSWGAQQVNMFRNFANQVFSGKLNADWPMWSLKTQQVVDACFESALNR